VKEATPVVVLGWTEPDATRGVVVPTARTWKSPYSDPSGVSGSLQVAD